MTGACVGTIHQDLTWQKSVVNAYTALMTPEDIKLAALGKRVLLHVEVPEGAAFLRAYNTPGIVDMLGFSAGGGPPALLFQEPLVQEKRHLLYLLSNPGQDVREFVEQLHPVRYARYRDVLTILGALVVITEVDTGLLSNPPDVPEALVYISERFRLVGTIQYRVPPLFQQMVEQ